MNWSKIKGPSSEGITRHTITGFDKLANFCYTEELTFLREYHFTMRLTNLIFFLICTRNLFYPSCLIQGLYKRVILPLIHKCFDIRNNV